MPTTARCICVSADWRSRFSTMRKTIALKSPGRTADEGNDVAMIATGLMVNEALIAARALADEGITRALINIAPLSPLDEEIVVKAAKERKGHTCEEHSIIGGLGEAVAGVLSEKCPTMMRRIGVNDEFGHSGPAWEVLRQFGLCADHIAEVARDFVKK